MQTEIGWLLEGRVIYLKISGTLTEAMLSKNASFLVNLLDNVQGDDLIHTIIDSLAVDRYDMPMFRLHALSKPFIQHPKLTTIVDVTTNLNTQTAGSLVNNIALKNWTSCATTLQALQYLKRLEPDLPRLDETVFEEFAPLVIIEG